MNKLSLVFFLLVPVKSYAFFGTDLPILMSIASNTASQVVRLETLIKGAEKQLEFTKRLKESTDEIREAYDTLDDVQSTLVSIVEASNGDIEGLEDVNDTIENVIDKKERLARLMKSAEEANKSSTIVANVTKESQASLNAEMRKNRKQELKSFGGGSVKNQTQVTAQNTALINTKLSTTNSILKKTAQNNAEVNKVIVADIVSRQKDLDDQEDFLNLNKKKRN